MAARQCSHTKYYVSAAAIFVRAKVMAYTYLTPSWVIVWEAGAGPWRACGHHLGRGKYSLVFQTVVNCEGTRDCFCAGLTSAARSEVQAFSARHPGAAINVSGFTDAVGSTASNQRLSERRATTVATQLRLFGTIPIFLVLFVLLGFVAGVKTMLRSANEIQAQKIAEAEAKATDRRRWSGFPPDGPVHCKAAVRGWPRRHADNHQRNTLDGNHRSGAGWSDGYRHIAPRHYPRHVPTEDTMATETHEAVGEGLADATGVAAHNAAESAPGMPQLNFDHFGNQIFWLLVTLVVIYLILSRIALPRIAAVLAERQGTITNDLSAAEDLKRQAIEAEEVYNKALADARAEAQAIAAETKAEIQGELDTAIAKADAEIAAKAAESEKAITEIRASAMANVEVVAKDTAQSIVAALGGKADAKALDAAVSARLKG
ncbi:ATP synthase subunit b 2 [Nymphon striatum]|nr:ATP synthase subunit b 2 [Nymphon striatum]